MTLIPVASRFDFAPRRHERPTVGFMLPSRQVIWTPIERVRRALSRTPTPITQLQRVAGVNCRTWHNAIRDLRREGVPVCGATLDNAVVAWVGDSDERGAA